MKSVNCVDYARSIKCNTDIDFFSVLQCINAFVQKPPKGVNSTQYGGNLKRY